MDYGFQIGTLIRAKCILYGHFSIIFLIDLGSSLGSDTYHANIDRIGNEYQMDAAEIMSGALNLRVERTD